MEKDNVLRNKSYLHRHNKKVNNFSYGKTLKKIFFYSKKPILYALGILLFIFLATPLVTYVYFVRDLSSKENIMVRKNEGVILTDRDDQPYFTFYEARTNKTATLAQIPDYLEEAVIASEDKDFYKHPGFSIRGIIRAIVVNLQNESLSQGGSTISQQLIKNTLLSQSRNFLRKYQELVLALDLERRYSKKDILEMYLNTVYFGEGAFGIEDAAEKYFSKNASDLTLSESAMLVGLLPAPSAFSPISGDLDKAFNRQAIVLSEMRKEGYITSAQETQAKKTKLIFNPSDNGLNQTALHYALIIKDELIKRYGEQKVARSGYTVKTSLNLKFQEYAESTVKNQINRLSQNQVSNGAAVAIDPKTGEVLTLVGSHDWTDETNGKINMAIAPRQPGSSFKPFVYAKAFEQRILTPGSIIEDKETTFTDGYKPKNYDGKFRGNVTARYALANSLNIPAVKTLQAIGVSSGIEMAERLGITTLSNPEQYGLSLTLGSAEIPLILMTNAFSAFANQGKKSDLVYILEIKDKKGKAIYKNNTNPNTVMDSDIAFLISSILADNKARAETFGNLLTLSRQAAVKTGTTEDYRDSLTIGYTPSLVVGVWVGNNDNSPMNRVAGSTGAAPIWRILMENFLSGTAIEIFTPTSGVRGFNICRENGLKSTVATSSAYLEYFLRGTEPKKNCDPSPTVTEVQSPTPNPSETPKPTNTPEPTSIINPTNNPQPSELVDPTNILLPTILP